MSISQSIVLLLAIYQLEKNVYVVLKLRNVSIFHLKLKRVTFPFWRISPYSQSLLQKRKRSRNRGSQVIQANLGEKIKQHWSSDLDHSNHSCISCASKKSKLAFPRTKTSQAIDVVQHTWNLGCYHFFQPTKNTFQDFTNWKPTFYCFNVFLPRPPKKITTPSGRKS